MSARNAVRSVFLMRSAADCVKVLTMASVSFGPAPVALKSWLAAWVSVVTVMDTYRRLSMSMFRVKR